MTDNPVPLQQMHSQKKHLERHACSPHHDFVDPRDASLQDLAMLTAEIFEICLHFMERLDHVTHLLVQLGHLENTNNFAVDKRVRQRRDRKLR